MTSNPNDRRKVVISASFFFPFLVSGLIGFPLLTTGCGSGLSGGSVPLPNSGGNNSRLSGTVISATDPVVALAGAIVVALSPTGQEFRTVTNASGQFVLIVPKGGFYALTVQPPQEMTALLADDRFELEVAEDEIQIIVPLFQRGVQMPMVHSARLEPSSVRLKVGERVTFRLILEPPPPLRPTPIWSVHGAIGTIRPDGAFEATKGGEGRVEARLGRIRAFARVTVADR